MLLAFFVFEGWDEIGADNDLALGYESSHISGASGLARRIMCDFLYRELTGSELSLICEVPEKMPKISYATTSWSYRRQIILNLIIQ